MAGKASRKSVKVARKTAVKRVARKPKLLSGGNPPIAKADGVAPVQAYIAAMPVWWMRIARFFLDPKRISFTASPYEFERLGLCC